MSLEVVSMQEAQNSLSQLVKRAAAGESILIGNYGRAEAVLSPVANVKPKRQLGGMEGKLIIPDDFDDPLPPEILAAFGCGEAGE
jgi:prevent-host-death family protein